MKLKYSRDVSTGRDPEAWLLVIPNALDETDFPSL